MEFIARATLPMRFHVYQLQHILCLPCRGLGLNHVAGRVGFNSNHLASSTIANDYSDFVRTLAYTSLTPTITHRIQLRLVGFINNRRQLLDFVKNACRHVATTSTTRFAYKLVGLDCAWRHARGYIDYSSRLQN
jgi:hypothetical protein